ncbi:MAG: hypothetical protein FAZ92_03386 [Accumulibacter sp.]|nr:MAG: hypothetical protein FAZ92_03386 [Accumulibacter sp.]
MPIRVSLPEPLALPLARLAVTPLAPLTPEIHVTVSLPVPPSRTLLPMPA